VGTGEKEMRYDDFDIGAASAMFIIVVILYIAVIVTIVLSCAFGILWLLQYFHVIGGCVCP